MQHLLWALMLLKTYETEPGIASWVGGIDEKTLRKWAWVFIEEISFLEPEVVSKYGKKNHPGQFRDASLIFGTHHSFPPCFFL